MVWDLSLLLEFVAVLVVPLLVWIIKLLRSITRSLDSLQNAVYGADNNPNHKGLVTRSRDNEERLDKVEMEVFND